jgi:HK97 family phage major capsid protein
MKVKVHTKKLEELFTQYHEAVLKGNLDKQEAGRRLGRAEEEDSIFSEHQTRMREDQKGSRHAGNYQSPIRFADPADANGRRGRSLATGRQAQKAIMAAIPGEESHLIPNMQDNEGQALHRRSQDLNDALILLKVCSPSFDWRSSKLYDEYQNTMSNAVSKVGFSTSNTGGGAEFIPNTLSSQLIPPFRDALTVMSTLQHFTMTDSPQKFPLVGASMTAFHMGEDTTDSQSGTAITRATPATSSVTFTARDIKLATYMSTEMNEDSIVASLPLIRQELGTALGEGWDDAGVNGDRSSSHQDADVTEGGTSVKVAINGLRSLVNADAKVSAAASSNRLAASDFIAARTKMGRYAQNPADLVIFLGYTGIQHLVGDTDLQKLNEFGSQATLLTGTIGSILGAPVVPTAFISNGLNATGTVDAAASLNFYTVGLQVNRRAFWVGDRRNITIKSEEEILTDRILVVGTFRGDLQQIASPTSAGHRPISQVQGIDSTFAAF